MHRDDRRKAKAETLRRKAARTIKYHQSDLANSLPIMGRL